ncbi:MAG TPA: neutral zinc metallopeptidase [Jatrophihabitans sp.]|uniref:KPN_02809 family neutral zinc metallopeptidase n=1 Tax=Jatrophihabitans sp. TaxID=1932789 RepID=UPI002DFB9D39|nr:neutral zinc metallopeptidase [Jatrophihabitans sp.]
MEYNDNASLDTSEVSDTRGGGGGLGGMLGGRGVAFGGGGIGIVGVVIYLLMSFVGGSNPSVTNVLGQLGQDGQPAVADNAQIQQECKTGQDANTHLECAVVADINSIQDYWAAELPKFGGRQYTPVKTVWFSGQVSTGCGAADSGAGPFYCPADKLVYIDLTFYNDLKTQFGAEGGLFVDAYVLAHEYGHHVQDLLGTEAKVRTRSGPTSDSVRLELQADCYAGVWAKHATERDASGQTLVKSITADDISRALDAAKRIGDDYIQKNLGGGTVDTSKFTHGSAAQREKWFTTGYRTGAPGQCDTFGTKNLG